MQPPITSLTTHGTGEIQRAADPDEGARFRVSIPHAGRSLRNRGDARSVGPTARSVREGRGTAKEREQNMTRASILIVDDEPIVREALRDWLVDAGYSVTTAETGEQALDIVAERDFGLAILDVRLPGKTGIRVLQEMKEMKPDIKAIIITAYGSPEIRAEATKLGAGHYLAKPISPDRLETLVEEALSDQADAE